MKRKKNSKINKTNKFNNLYYIIVMSILVVGTIVTKIRRYEMENMLFKETAVTTCKITFKSNSRRITMIDYFYIVDGVTYRFSDKMAGADCHAGDFYLVKYSLKDYSFHEILWNKGKQPQPVEMDSH